MTGASTVGAAVAGGRLLALDWMRGLVMVLMTVDHASGAFNAGRLFTDSVFMYRPGTPLPIDQFLTRWITHLCAPTFVFLAGTALALSFARRQARGESARSLDRYLLVRGLLLIALEPAWMSWVFTPGRLLFQVLYAIGGSWLFMIPLRRLPASSLLVLGLALLVGDEGLALLLREVGAAGSAPAAMLVTGGRVGPAIFAYALLPWLGMMLLGWSFGVYLAKRRERLATGWRPTRMLLFAGLAALAVFAVVRAANGYGNALLAREDGSLVQWLHLSKYPPSLSFSSLELGLMSLFLAGFFALSTSGAQRWLSPLALFGQTALFFYLLHVHLLELAAWATSSHKAAGLGATYLASLAALLALGPLCWWYRRYKRAHPQGWTRYI